MRQAPITPPPSDDVAKLQWCVEQIQSIARASHIDTAEDLRGEIGDGYQPLDADLTAFAALSTNGVVARIGGAVTIRTDIDTDIDTLQSEVGTLQTDVDLSEATLAVITARPAPDIGVAIAFVENQNYRMDQKASVAYRIDEVVSICDSGTCTATVYIDGVAITATANSVSTSEQTRTPTAANSVAVGSDVRVTITSNSACEGALIKCKCSYT